MFFSKIHFAVPFLKLKLFLKYSYEEISNDIKYGVGLRIFLNESQVIPFGAKNCLDIFQQINIITDTYTFHYCY